MSSPEPLTADRRDVRPALLGLVVLVLLVFGRLCVAEFAQWDDPYTIADNPAFRMPIGEALREAWTESSKGLYVPVTLTVWTLLASLAHTTQPDAQGSLINPWVFHTFNVACHVGSTLLVFAILRRSTATHTAAWFGAAVFAVHPLQVEAVAWASGTKDLLCWLFSLGATLLYVRDAQRHAGSLWGRPGTMSGVAILLVLALLSKPSAMVLPAAFFVLDAMLIRRRTLARIAIDLSPLFCIALAGALVGRWAQYVSHITPAPLWARPLIAGDALFHYLTKLFWPQTLTLDYGRTPHVVLSQSATYVRWLLPVAVGLGAIVLRRRVPQLLAGVLVALIGVAPVLGFATFQMQGYSTVTDHYVYFSMLGVAIIVAGLIDQPSIHRRLIAILASVVVATLSVRAFLQAGLWHDSPTLLAHAIAANPNSPAMNNNLADYYLNLAEPRPDLAKPLVDRAVRLDPKAIYTVANRIQCLSMLGQLDEADADLQTLSEILDDPRMGRSDRVRWLTDTSRFLLAAGRVEQARQWAQRAAELAPNSPVAQQSVAAVERAAASTRPTVR